MCILSFKEFFLLCNVTSKHTKNNLVGLPMQITACTITLMLTSVNPVHNAQVCYFNNVWLMFLVF
jgi:hypothetical protein